MPVAVSSYARSCKASAKPLEKESSHPIYCRAQPRCTWHRHISQSLLPLYGMQRDKSQTLMCVRQWFCCAFMCASRYTKVFNGALHRVIPPGRELAVIKPISSRLAGVPRALSECVTECLAESKHNLGYAMHPTAVSV